jgi:NADH-ubiquinone oxidoreductase chain 6
MINLKNLLIEFLVVNAIASAILVIISKNPVVSVIFLISLVLNSALYLIVKGMPFIGISYILIYLGAIIVLFLFVIMMINIKLTDILEVGSSYTKNIPLALIVSGLFLYEFFNILPFYLNNTVISLDNTFFTLFKEFNIGINNLIFSLFTNLSNFFNLSSGNIPAQSIYPYLGGDVILQQGVFGTSPSLSYTNWPETFLMSYAHIIAVAYSLYTYGAFLFLICGFILLLAMIAPIYLSKHS